MKKVIISILMLGIFIGCGSGVEVQSLSGTKMAVAGKVKVNTDGKTVEQQNIIDRIKMDNEPGSIKHFYVISAYSGQVIIYSTVRGKVTSSGKRLTPNKIIGVGVNQNQVYMPEVVVGGDRYQVDELLGEDGVVGSSSEYLYWWDTKGVYHQHYVSGGQIVHVSSQPLAVKGIIINMELSYKQD